MNTDPVDEPAHPEAAAAQGASPSGAASGLEGPPGSPPPPPPPPPPVAGPSMHMPPSGPAYGTGGKPSNFMVWSIANLICLCWPAGILALVFSLQVDSCYRAGDYLGAQDMSRRAKVTNIVATSIAGAFLVLYLVLAIIGIAADTST